MWYRLLVIILRPICFLLHPYRVEGKESIPAGGRYILCCNHHSGFDPVYLALCQPRRIAYMAKAELFRTGFQRVLFEKMVGAFPVERGKGDMSAIEMAGEKIAAGHLMGIFPEGTRSRDGLLHRFKSGVALIAAQTNAGVIPCAIDRPGRLFHRITIRFGTPLSPEELHLTGEKPELRYATRLLREKVAELSGQELA